MYIMSCFFAILMSPICSYKSLDLSFEFIISSLSKNPKITCWYRVFSLAITVNSYNVLVLSFHVITLQYRASIHVI